jgi:hypothetical protein
MSTVVVGEAMPATKNQASAARLRCSGRSGNWRRWLFTDPYLRLIAGVEIQTAAATTAAPSMAHIYISVIAEQTEKPPATMFPIMQRARIRQGVEAWSQLQDSLRELAALNKERLIPTKAEK